MAESANSSMFKTSTSNAYSMQQAMQNKTNTPHNYFNLKTSDFIQSIKKSGAKTKTEKIKSIWRKNKHYFPNHKNYSLEKSRSLNWYLTLLSSGEQATSHINLNAQHQIESVVQIQSRLTHHNVENTNEFIQKLSGSVHYADILLGNTQTTLMKFPNKFLKLNEFKRYKEAIYIDYQIDYQSHENHRAPDNDNCLIQCDGLLMTSYQFTLMRLFHPDYTEKAEIDFSLLIFTSNGIEECHHKITRDGIEISIPIVQHPWVQGPTFVGQTNDTASLLANEIESEV